MTMFGGRSVLAPRHRGSLPSFRCSPEYARRPLQDLPRSHQPRHRHRPRVLHARIRRQSAVGCRAGDKGRRVWVRQSSITRRRLASRHSEDKKQQRICDGNHKKPTAWRGGGGLGGIREVGLPGLGPFGDARCHERSLFGAQHRCGVYLGIGTLGVGGRRDSYSCITPPSTSTINKVKVLRGSRDIPPAETSSLRLLSN